MLKVNRGHEIEVYYALKKMNGIKEIYRILGEYSIFMIIQAKDQPSLDHLIEDIRNTSEVTDFWRILVSNDDMCEAEIIVSCEEITDEIS
jgi:DNA-binding Lrp family transcriptional regulator